MTEKIFKYDKIILQLNKEAKRLHDVKLNDNLEQATKDGYYKLECTVNKDTIVIKRILSELLNNEKRDYVIEDINDEIIHVFVFDITKDEIKEALQDKGIRNYCDSLDAMKKDYPNLVNQVNELTERILILENKLK
jgi:polyhydroxyalkanoate synthesis regulator phasin